MLYKATILLSVRLQRGLRMRRSLDVYKMIQYDIFGAPMSLSLVYSLFPKLLPHKEKSLI